MKATDQRIVWLLPSGEETKGAGIYDDASVADAGARRTIDAGSAPSRRFRVEPWIREAEAVS